METVERRATGDSETQDARQRDHQRRDDEQSAASVDPPLRSDPFEPLELESFSAVPCGANQDRCCCHCLPLLTPPVVARDSILNWTNRQFRKIGVEADPLP